MLGKGRELALWGVPAVLFAGLLTALFTSRAEDLANLYRDERSPRRTEPEWDTPPLVRGDTGHRDTDPQDRIPAAPLVATKPPTSPRRTFHVLCSPSAKHLFTDALEDAFEETHPGIDLEFLEAQDRSCIGSVIMQNMPAAIVGMPLSRNEQNRGLVTKIIGYHIAVLIVHRDNDLTTLFSNQLDMVLDGRISNWSELGRQHLEIQPVFEHPSHRSDPAARLLRMTGKAAQAAALLRNGDQVIHYVSREPRGLGIVSLAELESHAGQVNYLEIDTVRPNVVNYLRGAYPLGCTFWLVHARTQQREVVLLSRFLHGKSGRRVLEKRLSLPYLRSKNR